MEGQRRSAGVGKLDPLRANLFCLWLAAFSFVATAADKGNSAEIELRKCRVTITGTIRKGDDWWFARRVAEGLKGGCAAIYVHVYSPGGDVEAALKIARQVHALQAETFAPRASRVVHGSRLCQLGEVDEKGEDVFSTYNPRTNEGDERCVCASACFFIWIAGAERQGDLIEVHRPYIAPEIYKEMDATAARFAYEQLSAQVKALLEKLEVPNAIVTKVFATGSDKVLYLTEDEVSSLRAAPYIEELKNAKCGSEPALGPSLPSDASEKYSGPLQGLSPAERRWYLKRVERQLCWVEQQKQIRGWINARYLIEYDK